MGERENTVFALPDISHSIWKTSGGKPAKDCNPGVHQVK
jgi:hypothetical protein